MKMRAKKVMKYNIPTFSELYDLAPIEIKDYIDRCEETPQSPKWHPEGNVLIHIKLVYDRAMESGDINQCMAAFFHDLGKADSTHKNKRGDWAAHGHENISARLAKKYANWIEEMGANAEEVINIVAMHMRIKYMDEMRPVKQKQMEANPYYNKIVQFTPFDSMRDLTDEEMNRYK